MAPLPKNIAKEGEAERCARATCASASRDANAPRDAGSQPPSGIDVAHKRDDANAVASHGPAGIEAYGEALGAAANPGLQAVAESGDSAMFGASNSDAGFSMRIEDVLATQGIYVGTTVGTSMRPMLRNRRDTIIVEPLGARRLRRFEVPLYRRGSAYVLHRCVGVHDGSYTMLGDNCLNKERNIQDERVIGVLTGFYRGEKRVNMNGVAYRAYVRAWYAIYPLRRCFMRARLLAGRVKRLVVGAGGHADAQPGAAMGADACSGASVASGSKTTSSSTSVARSNASSHYEGGKR